MKYTIKEEEQFKYIESGGDKANLLLLHGLFGGLSNFDGIINYFGEQYNVVVPILPIFELPLKKATLSGLLDYIEAFVAYKKYEAVHLVGNSLGGHIALLFALNHPKLIKSITLTGSSGLFESAFGSGFPQRGNYEYIKTKTQETFYDPEIASKEMVDEVFEAVNNRGKALRIVTTAKSAVRHNLGDKLGEINAPTLLVWGKDDTITPPFVGEKFQELIPNATLILLDKCGHAPMMEHPSLFNEHLADFLKNI